MNHDDGSSSGGVPDFPLFVSLRGKTVLVVGGGPVAAGRAEKLLGFGARVHVVSPEISPGLERLIGREGLRWTRGRYDSRHLDGAFLVVAATGERAVNARVGADARRLGVPASVADAASECTFFFPAIVASGALVAGVVSRNGDHTHVKRAAARLREEMDRIDADYQGGKP